MSEYQNYQTGNFSLQSNQTYQPSFENYKNSIEGAGGNLPQFGGGGGGEYSQNIASLNAQKYDSLKRDQIDTTQNMESILQKRELRQESTVEVLKKAEDIIRNSQFMGSSAQDYQLKSVQPFQGGSNQFIQDTLATSGIGKVDFVNKADNQTRYSQLSQIDGNRNQTISPSPSGGVFSHSTLNKEKSVDDIIADIKTRSSQVGGSHLIQNTYYQNVSIPIVSNQVIGSSRDVSPIQSVGNVGRPAGVTTSIVGQFNNNYTPSGNTPIGGAGLSGNISPSNNVQDILQRYKKTQTFTSQYSENISLAQEFPQSGVNQTQQRTYAEDDTMRNHFNENSVFEYKQYNQSNSNLLNNGDANSNLQKVLPSGFTPRQQTPLANNQTATIVGKSQIGQVNTQVGDGGQDYKAPLSNNSSNAVLSHQIHNQQSQSSIVSPNPVVEELVKKYSQNSLSQSFVSQNNQQNFYRQASQNIESQKDLVNIQSNNSQISQYQNSTNRQVEQDNHSLGNQQSQQDTSSVIKKQQQQQQQFTSPEPIKQQNQSQQESQQKPLKSQSQQKSQQKQSQQQQQSSEKSQQKSQQQSQQQRQQEEEYYYEQQQQQQLHEQQQLEQQYSSQPNDQQEKVKKSQSSSKKHNYQQNHENIRVENQQDESQNNKPQEDKAFILAQFVHHCAYLVQKQFRIYIQKKLLNIPNIRKLHEEIYNLEEEKARYPDDFEFNQQIDDEIYEKRLDYNQKVQSIKRVWAKQYQDRAKRKKGESQQQSQKPTNQRDLKRQSTYEDDEFDNRIVSTQRSHQRIDTDDQRGRKESKTVRVKEPSFQERKINPYDDLPVGGKTKKVDMGWENAYPADQQLDQDQLEFIEKQKKRGSIQRKHTLEEEAELHEHEERKNVWDDIPIGVLKKKGQEQNWDEYPDPQSEKKPKVVKEKKAEAGEKGTADSSKPNKNLKKTKEQIENLKKRTKYDPRKAIEQAKQKVSEENQNSPQRQDDQEHHQTQEQQQTENDQNQINQQSSSPIKKKPFLKRKPTVKRNVGSPKQNHEEEDDIHVPNEDESQNKVNVDQQPIKRSPKQQREPVKKSQKTKEINNIEEFPPVEQDDQQQNEGDDKSKKQFLKKKPKEIKTQKLNWKNVKSRTDTGRQELEQSKQYNKQQKMAQQELKERQNQLKKNQKNQVLPYSQYYQELNYIDEDEAFNEPINKKGNQLNISNSRNPNQYYDHNHQKQITQQQYPVAPKIFTEYLPNKAQQKAIHQASPTQPSQEIIIRPQMFQNKYVNSQEEINMHYVDGNQDQDMEREQQLLEFQKKLQNQQNNGKYKNIGHDLEQMRLNKRESILNQQQQQQYPQQQQTSQQFMQDYQRMTNQQNQYSEEQIRELQSRQLQQQQNQHKISSKVTIEPVNKIAKQ